MSSSFSNITLISFTFVGEIDGSLHILIGLPVVDGSNQYDGLNQFFVIIVILSSIFI
jgi:hypothetical protein